MILLKILEMPLGQYPKDMTKAHIAHMLTHKNIDTNKTINKPKRRYATMDKSRELDLQKALLKEK